MNKDNVAERIIEEFAIEHNIGMADVESFAIDLLTSHRLSLKEELLKKLPKECEFDCKEIINQVLKEK